MSRGDTQGHTPRDKSVEGVGHDGGDETPCPGMPRLPATTKCSHFFFFDFESLTKYIKDPVG